MLSLLKRDQVHDEITRQAIGGDVQYNDGDNPDACDIVRRTLSVKMSECNLFSIFYMFNSLRNSNKKLFDAEKLVLFV